MRQRPRCAQLALSAIPCPLTRPDRCECSRTGATSAKIFALAIPSLRFSSVRHTTPDWSMGFTPPLRLVRSGTCLRNVPCRSQGIFGLNEQFRPSHRHCNVYGCKPRSRTPRDRRLVTTGKSFGKHRCDDLWRSIGRTARDYPVSRATSDHCAGQRITRLTARRRRARCLPFAVPIRSPWVCGAPVYALSNGNCSDANRHANRGRARASFDCTPLGGICRFDTH